MCPLIGLEARSWISVSPGLTPGVSGTELPWEVLGQNLFPACSGFQWLLAYLGVWPHYSNLKGQCPQFSLWSIFL